MAAYRRVYDSRHLQTDCQEPGSTPELYARLSSMGRLYLVKRGAISLTSFTGMIQPQQKVPAVTPATLKRPLPVLLLGEQEQDGCEQFA